jgi:hypothetical protein
LLSQVQTGGWQTSAITSGAKERVLPQVKWLSVDVKYLSSLQGKALNKAGATVVTSQMSCIHLHRQERDNVARAANYRSLKACMSLR